ncbi:hypothetical protein PFISCL1PPCAC_10948 [Pristionchus fissidentatus]|uniref:RBR-type E3 ubiquitin transferase n=1 Tax=Pristionchus fissidentatus TaxID=1538716 RepID=A0AAV5VJ65_9BILA|nr:hypothetical protein PFISCL1PPCAC_10948 [Pristionchus fissidentatus]
MAATSTTLPTSSLCCICLNDVDDVKNSVSDPILDLRCGHLLCIPCFSEMVKSGLTSAQFSLHPLHGYTIGCPWPTCKAVVKDPHHFALAGSDIYSDYKSRALDAFVAEDAVKCPHCSIAFIWEPPSSEAVSTEETEGEGERPTIECPHCLNQFCAVCRREPCTCGDEEAANRVMFDATTRRCPRCSARTERTGGCAHIRCTACGEHWCFVCVGPWTEDCQWNHWFS